MASVLQQLKVARRSARNGDRSAARALCLEILKRQPNCLLAHRLLAWIGLDTGGRETITHLQQCAAIDPEDPLAEVGQAIYAELNGVSESALQHFSRAAELDPDDERIQGEIARLGGSFEDTGLSLGVQRLRAGDAKSAADVLRDAAVTSPSDAAIKLALARSLWILGLYEQAVGLATQVSATHPLSIASLMFSLAAEIRRGRGLRARELQSRVEAIDPGFILHADLGSVLALPVSK